MSSKHNQAAFQLKNNSRLRYAKYKIVGRSYYKLDLLIRGGKFITYGWSYWRTIK